MPGQATPAVLGLAIDITEDKARERRLLASERKYRALLDNAVDAILLADMEGKLLDANRQAEQLLGYSREELSRMHASELHPTEELPQVQAVFRKLSKAGTTRVTHPVIRGNGEQIRCEVAASLIRYGDDTVIQGIFRDITERERRMQARLEEEQRHRTTLIREVHHRIKNNLQGVVGLLRQQAGAHPELEAAMTGAIGQVQSIALVHGLQGKGDDLKVWLCEMVEAIATATAPLARAPVEPSIDLGAGSPIWIHTEAAVPVALVLNELIQNAAKHGGGDGVQVRLERDAEHSARILVSASGRLPAEFDFNRGQGLGTGLELVRALLPQQGARLEFEQTGERTRARLELTPPLVHF
ncbi:sensor histidine kinase [Thiohalobacter thiocyanaticus]|uniref:histidine kinase n=1 Tax=Thiohalobacter thiocyanaticus TaxID=585455 RepID=A0A426QLR5_9GAMM|nr:PAS domain S-box protein [Thiohalobacter thiocyanaticus]RRQ22616.1 PAS domain S-box protein [Thiohalobacter thiocyanaticus]